MNCANCHKKISRSTKFCPECGAKVEPLADTPAIDKTFVSSDLTVQRMLASIEVHRGTELRIVVEGSEELKSSVVIKEGPSGVIFTADIPVIEGTSMPYFSSNGFSQVNGSLYFDGQKVDTGAGELKVTLYLPEGCNLTIADVYGKYLTSDVVLGDFSIKGSHCPMVMAAVGNLEFDVSGEETVKIAGANGNASVDISGDVKVILGPVTGDLEVDCSGSFDVTVTSVTGDINADLSGVGVVTIKSGNSGKLKADVSGAGSVLHYGIVASLNGDVSGAGRVWAKGCTGKVKKDVSGAGSVSVG